MTKYPEYEQGVVGKFSKESCYIKLLTLVSKMDNARMRYVSIKNFSSTNIYALLDSTGSSDQGKIEKLMNNSDTEFLAEDETIIYNDSLNEGNWSK